LLIIIVLFAFAYLCFLGSLAYAAHRWRKHLDAIAIPGLDTKECPSPPAAVSMTKS
jgi:hypothetical protein